MTLDGYAYEILELVRKELTDDMSIDIRLVKQLITEQRELMIYNALMKGAGYDGGWTDYEQTTDCITLNFVADDCGGLPCRDNNVIWKSEDEFPRTISIGRRPSVLRIMPCEDCALKGEILFSSQDRMKYNGYGRANQGRLVAYIRDKHIWVGGRADEQTIYPDFIRIFVDGIFADPRDVPGFDEENDDYPIGKNWPYIKGQVINELITKINSVEDVVNDARDYVGRVQNK